MIINIVIVILILMKIIGDDGPADLGARGAVGRLPEVPGGRDEGRSKSSN